MSQVGTWRYVRPILPLELPMNDAVLFKGGKNILYSRKWVKDEDVRRENALKETTKNDGNGNHEKSTRPPNSSYESL